MNFYERQDKKEELTWHGKPVGEMTREEAISAFRGLADMFWNERRRNDALNQERLTMILNREFR